MISVTHRGPIWKTLDSTPPANLKLPPYYPDHPIAKADWTRFLKSIELMDVYVGAILKQLKTDGILNNVVIIFSSDHGRCMVRDKQFIYDGGIQIPCIISWPGNLKAGSMDNNLHSSIDISTSILDIAGIQRPPYMEGISFIGNNIQPRNYIIAARDRMDETVDKMRCVRTNQFKYIKNYYPERSYMQPNKYKETEYPVWNLLKDLKKEGKLTSDQLLFTQDTKPAEELYDIIKDPYELHNLAGNSQYRIQLKKMRKILQNWIKETGDKGQ